MYNGDSPNISFEFWANGDEQLALKIRPRSMQFERTRGEFDYCQAEFSQEVADHIRPHVNDEHSPLRQPLPVYLLIEGEPVYRLLYVSDGVTFGEEAVHIEFHDPQKYLTRGVVDWKQGNVKLKEAFEYVFDQRNTSGGTIFNDIKFSVPDESYEELRTKYRDGWWITTAPDNETDELIQEEREEESGSLGVLGEEDAIRKLEEENVYNIIDGKYAINFDKETPWAAMVELCEKFGVTTWAAPDGNLWVGSRRATGVSHITTPDDSRAWKLNEYNITETRDPVVRSVVRGGWVEDPSDLQIEDYVELVSLNYGTKDFRVEAVASKGESSFIGQEIFNESVDAKRDVLEEIAKRKMMNKQREQQTGHLEIDPELSGTARSAIRHAKIGDSILTIPPDDDGRNSSMCDTNIEEEFFNIVGIQHKLTGGGNWNVRLDVMKHMDGELSSSNIDTKLRYYDPSDSSYINNDSYSALKDEPETIWNKYFPV